MSPIILMKMKISLKPEINKTHPINYGYFIIINSTQLNEPPT